MFGMWMHVLLDYLFSKQLRNERRLHRLYFASLDDIPTKQWSVEMSENNPSFSVVDSNGDNVVIKRSCIGLRPYGSKVFLNELKNLSKDTSIIGTVNWFDSGYLFRILKISKARRQSSYVNVIYKNLCRRLRIEIIHIEVGRVINQQMEQMRKARDE